jgi:hypothetical protein
MSSWFLLPAKKIKFKVRIQWWIVLKKSLKTTKGNQKPYINEGQTIQWPTEKDKSTQNDQQRNTQKSKDRETRTSLTTGDEPRCVIYLLNDIAMSQVLA